MLNNSALDSAQRREFNEPSTRVDAVNLWFEIDKAIIGTYVLLGARRREFYDVFGYWQNSHHIPLRSYQGLWLSLMTRETASKAYKIIRNLTCYIDK